MRSTSLVLLPRVVLGIVSATAVACPATASPQTVPADSSVVERSFPIDPEAAPRPEAQARRTDERIAVDGRLDEPAWQESALLTGFVQSQPNPGYPATEPTVVRILYDARYLYFGFMCYESVPDQLVIQSLELDYGGRSARDFDVVAVALDSFLDRRNAFLFHVNPAGAMRDAQVFDDSRIQNVAWRGVWYARTEVSDSGWTAEIAIPWTTLRFDPGRDEQAWGLNLLRRVRRKNEDSYWAPLDRRDPLHRVSKAGTLFGLRGLRSGYQLLVKPFGLMAGSGGRLVAEGERGKDWDAGVDMKYGITPRLTLDLTYRTDFSQVEVDQEQVNLTRFSLFFPELREFFLENSGVFTFGDVSERNFRMGVSPRDFTMFHSRRIGLTDDGRRIPILSGGRLTGRAGAFEVGLLNIQTRAAAHGLPAENFSVVRVRRSVLGSSDVGVIFTNRQATGGETPGGYNRSFGADVDLRLLDHMIVNSYIAGTLSPGVDGHNLAWRLSAAWRDRLWDISALVRELGENFDPGVGFVRRSGLRHAYATFGAHPRPRLPHVQELNPYVEVTYITNPESVLETRTITLGLGSEFLDGGILDLELDDRFERLARPFQVRRDALVPPGAYTFREAVARYGSSAARPLAGSVSWSAGGYFNGTRNSVSAEAVWRPHYRWSLELSAQRNAVRLPETAFTADVYAIRLGYAYSTRLFGRAFVQYNGATDQLVTNVRVNFIHAPLSDVFLVLTERRDLAVDEVLERVLTAKVTRLVSF
ncbi:MAG: carbohydrate binding family 9 domain-containing protein [Gemmatimonadetes bacterium]|nr:carbohydrate binding family 9 domain-containing protein [Gemmatimonadota bacterium]